MMFELLENPAKRGEDARNAARILRGVNQSATTSSVRPTSETGSSPVIRSYSTSPASGLACEYLIVGVAGALRANFAQVGWIIEDFAEAAKDIASAPTLETANDIQWFRQSMGLSMGDIAILFGVTRKAVYDWLDGAVTQKASFIRAARSLIERELDASSRPYLRQFWESDVSGSGALFSILKLGDPSKLASDATRALRALARPVSEYARQAQSDSECAPVSHAYNHDEYRNL